MTFDPSKGRVTLRRGRYSQPGGAYFLTICTNDRQAGLTKPDVVSVIFAEMRAMTVDGTWCLRTAVVMPDHVHLLFVLGERLPLGKTVRRVKAKTSAALRSGQVEWERDFFDRQLRAEDDRLPIFQYIYLNPYRAGLIQENEIWPHYFCAPEDWSWFKELLHESKPFPEWLGK